MSLLSDADMRHRVAISDRRGGLDVPFHEMDTPHGAPRSPYGRLARRIRELGSDELGASQQAAEVAFLCDGVTFTVHGDREGNERVFPYDVVPRLIAAAEWERIERGLRQRVQALELFLQDLYGEEHILRDGIVPHELVYSCPHYRREGRGLQPAGGTHLTVVGSDLIRQPDGSFAVLEDNLRVPSGASYMLANRQVMKRVLPALFRDYPVRSVDHYPSELLQALRKLSPRDGDDSSIALLTPGCRNSAYFEHAFLARLMGTQLVEGQDLVVRDDVLYSRTTGGLRRIDVLYRRVDDDHLDPVCFRPDSVLGAAGLMHAYRAGNLALANAVGTGVADDKAIYAYVPEIIRYYLGAEAILDNVPTFLMGRPKERRHVLAHLDRHVVKAVGASGGYDMTVGPHASRAELEECRRRIEASPRNYIAQPTISLSVAPCLLEGSLQPRHVDLRVYVLDGSDPHMVPGGLTRVALREGSLVVNSSLGGGSKDTWVLHE